MGVMGWLRGWRRSEATCSEVRQHASEYLEGELSERLLGKVQRHVEWCPPCATFVRTLQATVGALRALPRRRAPDSLRQNILGKIRSSQEGQE